MTDSFSSRLEEEEREVFLKLGPKCNTASGMKGDSISFYFKAFKSRPLKNG